MKLRYEFGEEEFLAFQGDYISLSPFMRRNRILGIVSIAALVVAFAILGWTAGLFRGSSLIIFILMTGALELIRIKNYNKSILNNARVLLREGNNAAIFGAHETSLDEEGVISKFPSAEVSIRWEAFVKLTETDLHLILYVTSFAALVIPKRSSITDVEKEQVFNFIRHKMRRS